MLEAIGTDPRSTRWGPPRSATPSSPTERTWRSSTGRTSRTCAPPAHGCSAACGHRPSTKNPGYPDVLYVSELIGPDTVNTMPIETIEAFLDHGDLAPTLDATSMPRRRPSLPSRRKASHVDVTAELLDEGVTPSPSLFDDLIATIEGKRRHWRPHEGRAA